MSYAIFRGQVRNASERRRRDEIGEKLESLRKNSEEATKATGKITGPFRQTVKKHY